MAYCQIARAYIVYIVELCEFHNFHQSIIWLGNSK